MKKSNLILGGLVVFTLAVVLILLAVNSSSSFVTSTITSSSFQVSFSSKSCQTGPNGNCVFTAPLFKRTSSAN